MADSFHPVYVARTSFVANVEGKRRGVSEGDTINDPSDPILRSHRSMFLLLSRPVERATAAPGEKRSVPTHPQAKADSDEGDYACDDCDYVAKSKAGLGAHRRSHS